MNIVVYCLNYIVELPLLVPTKRQGESRSRELRYLPEGALAVVVRVENEDGGSESIEHIWSKGMWRHANVGGEPVTNKGIY